MLAKGVNRKQLINCSWPDIRPTYAASQWACVFGTLHVKKEKKKQQKNPKTRKQLHSQINKSMTTEMLKKELRLLPPRKNQTELKLSLRFQSAFVALKIVNSKWWLLNNQ